MKLIHLSDLHIGKRLNEFSLLEDQRYILNEILDIIEKERPQGVLLAGDIYDKSVPSAEGVALFDDFLTKLAMKEIPAFIISGNHDNPQRLSFGGRIMEGSGVHLSPAFEGKIDPVVLKDEYGEVAIFLLPFLKPAHVRSAYPEKEIASYEDGVKTAIDDMTISPHVRNILVAHQFVTGGATCESENFSVGGADNIGADLFLPFDYVALGHLHGPQSVGRETVRYCGSPLKYSFSEAGHVKSVTIVELKEKGDITFRTIPLVPMRDMREIKGTYMELSAKSYYEETHTRDYIHAILTDEEDVPDALGKLRSIYPNIMRLSYDNTRTQKVQTITGVDQENIKDPLDIIDDLYRLQNNRSMSEDQRNLASGLMREIQEED